MSARIEISTIHTDTRAQVRKRKIEGRGFVIEDIFLVDAYTLDTELPEQKITLISQMLTNPVTQQATIHQSITPPCFDWAIEIGYLPGVTDNVSHTVKEGIEDLLRTLFDRGVYTSQVTFLTGNFTRDDVNQIAKSLANPLIQRIQIFNHEEYMSQTKERPLPRVRLESTPRVDIVDILSADDETLANIGKLGIANPDGSRHGPLALDLTYMTAIQEYFRKKNRNPTDIELESIAQTWSEHCKHTIFADPIDEIEDGLFRTYIKAATNEIRLQKGEKDFCVSVFTDNSGAIIFDDRYLVTDKAETHNSPSALDPFGGAITGIVGVNRDTIGFGLGAKPVINTYGFCFAPPDDESPIYKGENFTQKMLSPRQIMDGVIEGVNVGGNCSGIPTPQGFVYFDERYKGKPLVFVGTVGLIPRESAGRKSHEKQAMPGDYIVMIGGRVGKDGIHGATFSSEAMDAGSPATAVQIGDPITQKKKSDVLIKEARDQSLYTSLTDNGAGGLSCSVAEMAKESGGCHVILDKVPLKYPGLEPWEIWISESQERMTASVPKEHWDAFSALMERRGVEATIIGEFTNTGTCIVEYDTKTVMDIDMDFLHDGLPSRPLQTTYTRRIHEEPATPIPSDLTSTLHSMLARKNIASFSFISQQYDHEVQGGSVIKPLQGRGQVNGDATVTRPLLDSMRAIVKSQGINPSYSDIDTYDMAACAIDTAIRNAICAGANLDHLALMDNFCWCSSNEPERLGELKAAARACYDHAVAYGTPFISGKDSMFNDFKGYDEHGQPIKISVPPTLLISAISVMEDARSAVSLDAKIAGDLIYLIGDTYDELGGSEYFAMIGEQQRGEHYIGNTAPKVDPEKNKLVYAKVAQAIQQGIIASAKSVHLGGLGVALAKTAMAGKLGMDVSLDHISTQTRRDDFTLFSESQGRIIVTIDPAIKEEFERIMRKTPYYHIGSIRNEPTIAVRGRNDEEIIHTTVDSLLDAYRKTFQDY